MHGDETHVGAIGTEKVGGCCTSKGRNEAAWLQEEDEWPLKRRTVHEQQNKDSNVLLSSRSLRSAVEKASGSDLALYRSELSSTDHPRA